MKRLKSIARVPFRLFGYDIQRLPVPDYTWLQELGIRTIFDIGANVGQYATYLRRVFPEARVYSFEPVSTAFLELTENMKTDQRFMAFNFALGDKAGEEWINRNEHTPASSFLPLGQLHRRHFVYAMNTHTERVRVERLDTVARTISIEDPVMLKIDVQGFEAKVISGGEEIIRRSRIVVVETSFESLYEGQPLFDDIYEMMKHLGFIYRGSEHQVRSDTDRRVLQENSVFLRLSA